ncbi:hypothetical protein TNCV_3081371 [Trichonephila clavipes]|nr:hypothetical protein TNCV_3081371 [Trichonephila clavipes]
MEIRSVLRCSLLKKNSWPAIGRRERYKCYVLKTGLVLVHDKGRTDMRDEERDHPPYISDQVIPISSETFEMSQFQNRG